MNIKPLLIEDKSITTRLITIKLEIERRFSLSRTKDYSFPRFNANDMEESFSSSFSSLAEVTIYNLKSQKAEEKKKKFIPRPAASSVPKLRRPNLDTLLNVAKAYSPDSRRPNPETNSNTKTFMYEPSNLTSVSFSKARILKVPNKEYFFRESNISSIKARPFLKQDLKNRIKSVLKGKVGGTIKTDVSFGKDDNSFKLSNSTVFKDFSKIFTANKSTSKFPLVIKSMNKFKRGSSLTRPTVKEGSTHIADSLIFQKIKSNLNKKQFSRDISVVRN